jgi:photosystem II stability/assembly factor-like uncharacterized protein
MIWLSSALAAHLLLAAPTSARLPAAEVRLDGPALAALRARAIGPAIMSGRIVDVAVDPGDPETFYLAHSTGGLFKTSNGGDTFAPLLDAEVAVSVGAVAVSPIDSRVVWVGTGEDSDRNSAGFGRGLLRSEDGGERWAPAGLPSSRAVARIVPDAADARAAWACVAGDLWGPGGERGVYRTADGGTTWARQLAAPAPHDKLTGCADLVADPADPKVLYAALYARRRTPWSFEYGTAVTGGADVGGVWKTSDGGATWKKLGGGLPSRTGNIGLAVAASDPKVVMAVVQSDEGGTSSIDEIRSRAGGVFRSEDGGATWTRRSPLNPRPFYFSQIRVDPLNPQRVYVLGFMLHVSEDGGKTFREDLFQKVHADCHALAIVPGAAPRRADPDRAGEPPPPPVSRRLILGTDGGAYASRDGGGTWNHLATFPAGQFYRIAVDDSSPYRICGGLQDNLTWLGPSRTWSKDGITGAHWENLGGGDGFYCAFDPGDRDVVYLESQQGYVQRTNLRTGEMRGLRPEPSEGQEAYRFHWNAPLIMSRHEKGVLWLGGNRVFRLERQAERFEVVSGDLTAADPRKTRTVGSGAENHAVIYALAESPRKAGMLWAGTDDGRLWLTEDGGKGWTDLTTGLPAAVKGQWISRLEPSHHDDQVAYLVVNGYRSQDLRPHLFRTADRGRTWRSVAGDLPADLPVRLVRESPRNPKVLFAGTEFGLYLTLDGGGHWTRFGEVPAVIVDDLVIHPRERDLVIATHGRSLYVVDDVGSLEEATPEALAKEAHLFAPRPAFGRYLMPGWVDSAGKVGFRGPNPPEGALITFHVRAPLAEPVKIMIATAAGTPVAGFEVPGVPGLGRVAWNLRPTKDFMTEYGGEGPDRLVPPGEYVVTLSYGKAKEKQKLQVTVAEGIQVRYAPLR